MEKIIHGYLHAKPAEQSFLLPSTTPILDNNFFVHREVLAWRYLAAACKPEGGGLKCQQGPAEFGALVPQDRMSMPVRMELVGKEKVTIRGAEHDLLRLEPDGRGVSSGPFGWTIRIISNSCGWRFLPITRK